MAETLALPKLMRRALMGFPHTIGAFAIAAVVVVAACSIGTSTGPSTSSAPSKVTWTSCGSGFQCGSVMVPLDYSHPSGATIKIALVRKPATDPAKRIGSLLINWGGPGDSGIDSLRGDTSLTKLNSRFDLIGFDPRGIGQSAPVHCLTAPQEDAINALDPVLDDPQEKQAAVTAYQGLAAGCQKLSAAELPFLDTASAARDMDVIRTALGDAKLTYLGFSYGTFLGETYAHLFPTHVRALSLDAVIDPTVSGNNYMFAQVVGFERSLQAFLADCKARTTCAFGHPGDPGAKLTALMSRLDANPLPVGNQSLTRGLAIPALLVGVIYPSNWPNLGEYLAEADAGDGTMLLQISNSINGRNPNGSYSGNAADAYAAIYCLDQPVPTDIAAYDQLGATLAQASPLFGPIRQYSNLVCSYWPVPPTRKPGPLTAPGAPPILLVGGTNDPGTPYAWAQSVNKQLTGSVLLTRQGYGHMSRFLSTCISDAEDSYLIDLKLPAVGTVCTSS
jgi:pimeloyl-ACP methyl ester carboxylesterase